MASLSLGQIDVTAGSPSAGLFHALNRGLDIRIVGDWARVGSASDATFALVARKELMDSGVVKSAADLKGKPVGIGPVHGGVNDMMIDAAMRKVGLTTDDITRRPFSENVLMKRHERELRARRSWGSATAASPRSRATRSR